MARLLLLVVLLALASGATAWAQTGQPVSLQVLEPANGARVEGREVHFRLAASGDNLPLDSESWMGDGEFHVRIDGVEVLLLKQLTFSLIGIPPGEHVIEINLQGWEGGGSNTTRTAIEVVATEQPAGSRWLLANTVVVVVVVIFGGLLLLWLFWVRPRQIEPRYDEQNGQNQEGQDDDTAPSGT